MERGFCAAFRGGATINHPHFTPPRRGDHDAGLRKAAICSASVPPIPGVRAIRSGAALCRSIAELNAFRGVFVRDGLMIKK